MIKLAIDVGSAVTKIYMSGAGIVLSEATCVAVEECVTPTGGKGYNIKAFGDKAKNLIGRTTASTHVIYPVTEGEIVNENLLAHLLMYFFEKIEMSQSRSKHSEVLFIVPCGINSAQKQKYVFLKRELCIGRAYLVQAPIAAVLGHNMPLTETSPVMCLDIGYGVTNIAALSLEGIISGMSINLGGSNIDVHVMSELAEEFNLRVGALTAERVKNTIGSLLEDDNKTMLVEGSDLSTGAPLSKVVSSMRLDGVIKLYIDKIIEYAVLVLNKLPAEVSSSVVRNGIYLSGGLIKLDGIADYVQGKLNLQVNVPEEPQFAQVLGGGIILTGGYLMERLTQEI